MSVPCRVRSSRAKLIASDLLFANRIKTPSVPAKDIVLDRAKLTYYSNSEEDGFCLKHPKKHKYYIYINSDLIAGQDNFAYAHELGHVILGHLDDYDIGSLTDKQLFLLNREADIFATNLLMPEKWVLSNVKDNINQAEIRRLKNMFDVSWLAMIHRLDELQICSKEESRNFFSNPKGALSFR